MSKNIENSQNENKNQNLDSPKEGKKETPDLMESLRILNNSRKVVKTKNILKALNKMGMDWIKRTLHQSTILQKLKAIIITLFIVNALLSVSAPKGPDGKIKADQIITDKIVEVNKSDVNVKNISDKDLKLDYAKLPKDAKIKVYPTSVGEEFKKRGWFNAFIILPVAQFINFISEIINPTFAIILLTSILQIFIMFLNTKSFKKQILLQKVNEEVKKIKDKIKECEDKKQIRIYRKEIRQLYKKNKLHPKLQAFSSFANLPFLFGVYYAIQRAYGIIFGTCLGTNFSMSVHNGFDKKIPVIIIVYILMGFFQLLQSNLNDILKRIYNLKAKNKKEVNTFANTFSSIFWTLIIVRIYWNWPVSLSFYWMITAMFGCIQICINHKLANEYIAEKEAQKADLTITEEKPMN